MNKALIIHEFIIENVCIISKVIRYRMFLFPDYRLYNSITHYDSHEIKIVTENI